MEELNVKLRNERDLFKGAFKDVLGKSAIESSAKVMEEMLEFFESSPALISVAVLTLRKSHGSGFNAKTVEIMLKLRIDIDSSEKKQILQSCKEVLAGYKEPKGTEKKAKEFFSKIEVEVDDQEESEEEEEEEEEEQKVEEVVEEKKEEVKEEVVEEKKLGLKTYEGYMEKKSGGLVPV